MPGKRGPAPARSEASAVQRVRAFEPASLTGKPTRLFYEAHDGRSQARLPVTTLLGLLGLLVYIAVVVVLAAGVTAAVVRISPTRNKAGGT
jgi:hypothetical protein